MFYNARWYDPLLGRFAQADTIVPGGVQGLDRYGYVNNAPTRFTDPSGHYSVDQIRDYLKNQYGNKWRSYFDAWQSDDVFWRMLLMAQNGDVLQAPTTNLGGGVFMDDGNGSFTFIGEHDLYEYQGYGPYNLLRDTGDMSTPQSLILHPVCDNNSCPLNQFNNEWNQPIFDYSSGVPVYSGYNRIVKYQFSHTTFDPLASDSVPWIVGGQLASWAIRQLPKYLSGPVSAGIDVVSVATAINNSIDIHFVLTVNYEDERTFIGPPGFTPPVILQPDWISQKDR